MMILRGFTSQNLRNSENSETFEVCTKITIYIYYLELNLQQIGTTFGTQMERMTYTFYCVQRWNIFFSKRITE